MDRDVRFEGGVPGEGVGVVGEPGRAQLVERAAGGAGQPGLLPDLGREAEGCGLLGVEGERREAVGVAAGVVADLAVDVVHGLDDQSELAQVVLVPLEHAVEGVVVARFEVRLDGAPELSFGQGAPGPEQTQCQVHQPLGLGNRHRRPFWWSFDGRPYRPGVSRPKRRAHA